MTLTNVDKLALDKLALYVLVTTEYSTCGLMTTPFAPSVLVTT